MFLQMFHMQLDNNNNNNNIRLQISESGLHHMNKRLSTESTN